MLNLLSPNHLARYKDIAMLFLKYRNDELITAPGADEHFSQDVSASDGTTKPEELANDLETMGPTFVKIGQLLSTRSDLLPPPYLRALERLQDDVDPLDFSAVEGVVTDELGIRISKAYGSFEEKPLASASLGQVHRATLRDGREVAVKVQRPGIRQQIVTDLDSLEAIADFVDEHTETGKRYEFSRILIEIRQNLMRELDYNREAASLREFGKSLSEFKMITVPQPVDDFCTSKVLTMDLIDGNPLTSLSGVTQTEIDGKALADEIFHAYLHQILVTGSFHADPHPGNVLLTKEHEIALIDLGMVGHIPERMREPLAHFLIAVSEGNGAMAAKLAMRLGEKREDFQQQDFENDIAGIVAEYSQAKVSDIQVGGLVTEVTGVCAKRGLRLPQAVIMLGKTLLNLDRVAKALDPDYDPNAAIREKAGNILQKQLRSQFGLSEILVTLRDMRSLAMDLPGKVNAVASKLAENKLKVDVDAIDEDRLLQGFEKIANRITTGIILASIIIGAAMMMRVETEFSLFGYPGIAIIFFLAAAIGGVVLAGNVLFRDKN